MYPDHTTNEIPYGYCHCGCGQKTTIAKMNNSRLGHIKGQPVRYIAGHSGRRPAELRFWEKVNKDGPLHPTLGTQCWLWTASTFLSGYGQFYDGQAKIAAHRFAYQSLNGPIPDGLIACHKCDVRLCINPDHLFLGTEADNTHDMFAKGRGRPPQGERSATARLNEHQVREIRTLFASGRHTQTELARIFGVTYYSIHGVIARKTWKHVK